ncbi:hypothetical protein HOLleu_10150 [Holothuria leucospilota]|uniref:Uncharacterized protein n=1 Tax=Holothuria leucospilota TaxID=206669 RepID=A0A9Q1CER2_HOLLE|nr:hypothetical protein HOLleu_10150 [Holothuria leucospilota]
MARSLGPPHWTAKTSPQLTSYVVFPSSDPHRLLLCPGVGMAQLLGWGFRRGRASLPRRRLLC